ncbi:ATP-dependent Lon protease [Aquabacterium commune]|uniref:ATP-dependent Lon protease n=1 Tax=Aquabacterium commune TaxID=70586 RepID=A0A4R6R6A2_9BURK|nr:AAA family ATPase [Aquabacterium commune]TDP81379.1 ATP-dependent Lon protease [Aquabacterium commune]
MSACTDLVPVSREGWGGGEARGARHGGRIPIAHMRHVYRVDEVERRLGKLPTREHESLRATYERMLEKGPDRFQVKPSGLPAMAHLYDELPNFHEVLDDLKRQLALCSDSHDALELTPMLLLGPPGVGKTHFAREVAQLLGTGMGFISMSSMTAGWVLSGASSQWKGARAGKVFETLVDGQYANPVMVVDEIDKGGGEHAYDPLGSLYSLLEHDTAGSFTDEFAEVPIDASQVIWVATANDVRGIPDPILNRMNVFDIDMPDEAAARQIAAKLYRSIRADHDWGQRFDPELSDAVLGALGRMAPREMRRALMTAFGNAKLDGRYALQARDLPDAGAKKSSIGFVQ